MKLLILPEGSTFEGTEEDSPDARFLKILHNGKTCFAPRRNLKKASDLAKFSVENAKRNQIAKFALSYLGTPYRWGGKSSNGIDCSGLCFMAYYMAGLCVYRDAEPDRRFVREIPFENLKKADLIYYNGHVTMYLGQGKYIHSSATLGGVTIGSFDRNDRNFYPVLSKDIVCCARVLAFSD